MLYLPTQSITHRNNTVTKKTCMYLLYLLKGHDNLQVEA